MAGRAPRDGQWSSSHSRDSTSLSSSRWQSSTPTSSAMAPMPPAPVHPLPQMQGAFEESMHETMSETGEAAADNPYLDADKYRRRKLLLEASTYERTVAGRWLQKQGENFHPLWKLVAQISFGMHLLQMSLARSDADVIQILQTHVDEIDGFLERTTEDFELAQQDIEDRIKHLRTPLEHGDVFDTMLGDREFRSAIVDGNEKIEHILTRTTVAMKDALKDIQKGLDGTRQLARFLKDIDRKWHNRSEEHAAVFSAMMGNTEGWAEAYKSSQQRGSELGLSLVQLEGIVSEIQRRAGVASRRNLPRYSSSSTPTLPRGSLSQDVIDPPLQSGAPHEGPQPESQTPTNPRRPLPTQSAGNIAVGRPGKSLHAIELPGDARNDRKSMSVSVLETASVGTRSSVPSQTNRPQAEDFFPDTQSYSELYVKSSSHPSRHHEPSQATQATHEAASLDRVTQHVGGQTYFPYASSDAESMEAGSTRSSGKSQPHSRIHDSWDEDDTEINHDHPIFKDLRVRTVLDSGAHFENSSQDPSDRSSADSVFSSARKDYQGDFNSLPRAWTTMSDAAASETNNRASANTMQTPLSLNGADGGFSHEGSLAGPSRGNRSLPPQAPPIVTDFSDKRGASDDLHDPPSPSLKELTSATVSGPDMGDPFAPASPREKPRSLDPSDRFISSMNGQNVARAQAKSVDTTSNTVTTKHEPLHIDTFIPRRKQASPHSAPTHLTTTTVVSRRPNGPSNVQTTTTTSTQTNPGKHDDSLVSAGSGSPKSPPSAVAHGNLSPFPSISSRGSRRPSLPVHDLATHVGEAQSNRKSGIKKFFNVRRSGRDSSIHDF